MKLNIRELLIVTLKHPASNHLAHGNKDNANKRLNTGTRCGGKYPYKGNVWIRIAASRQAHNNATDTSRNGVNTDGKPQNLD